jgi:hypothetical protein
MKRLGSAALILVLSAAGLVALAGPAQAADPGTVTQYDTEITVGADGDIDIVETLTVDFPDPRHGLFRDFGRQSIRPKPRLLDRRTLKIERDGKAEPSAVTRTKYGLSVKIGDPEVTLTGTHVYRISYTVKNAVQQGDDEGDKFQEFFWQPIGEEWELPILASTLTEHLPAPAMEATCTQGSDEAGSCEGEGTDTVTFETGRLDPGEGVTARIDYDLDGSTGPAAHETSLISLAANLIAMVLGMARYLLADAS